MSIDLNVELLGACKEGSLEQVRLLLVQGADVNAVNKNGSSALMLACLFNGDTALLRAAHYKRCIKVARLLLQHKINVNLVDRHGHTALTIACLNGFVGMVKLLLNNGADSNMVSQGGETFLMMAAYRGYYAIVRLLLERGISVNAQDERGDTALMDACNVGAIEMNNGDIIIFHQRYAHSFKVAQLLLQYGADPTVVNKKGKTALMAAQFRKALAIVKLLSDDL
jgi:ankyrin repeat protein